MLHLDKKHASSVRWCRARERCPCWLANVLRRLFDPVNSQVLAVAATCKRADEKRFKGLQNRCDLQHQYRSDDHWHIRHGQASATPRLTNAHACKPCKGLAQRLRAPQPHQTFTLVASAAFAHKSALIADWPMFFLALSLSFSAFSAMRWALSMTPLAFSAFSWNST